MLKAPPFVELGEAAEDEAESELSEEGRKASRIEESKVQIKTEQLEETGKKESSEAHRDNSSERMSEQEPKASKKRKRAPLGSEIDQCELSGNLFYSPLADQPRQPPPDARPIKRLKLSEAFIPKLPMNANRGRSTVILVNADEEREAKAFLQKQLDQKLAKLQITAVSSKNRRVVAIPPPSWEAGRHLLLKLVATYSDCIPGLSTESLLPLLAQCNCQYKVLHRVLKLKKELAHVESQLKPASVGTAQTSTQAGHRMFVIRSLAETQFNKDQRELKKRKTEIEQELASLLWSPEEDALLRQLSEAGAGLQAFTAELGSKTADQIEARLLHWQLPLSDGG